jgi:hypothetical protein
VLGEEHRIGATSLPIDRWMLERLQPDTARRHSRRALPPVAWHGRFAASTRSAEPDLVLPPVVEPPAPNTVPPSGRGRHAEPVDEPRDDRFVEPAPDTPPAVTPMDLDAFIAPAPADVEPPAFEAEMLEPASPIEHSVTPRPIVAHSQLDPEVRALVDDLYAQARAELSGIDTEVNTGFVIDDAIDAPAPFSSPVPHDAVTVEPPAPPLAPSAHDVNASTGDAARGMRGPWVPAFTPEEERRRSISD